MRQLYALEGFLARLAASPHAQRLVLEGGVLLAAYDTRRPTRDVDLQAQNLSNELDHVVDMVREIAAIPLEDGLWFDAPATGATIREQDQYNGIRVSLTGRLAAARLSLTSTSILAVAQPKWAVWRRKQRLDERVPADFGHLLRAVMAFADPALGDAARGAVRRAERGRWE